MGLRQAREILAAVAMQLWQNARKGCHTVWLRRKRRQRRGTLTVKTKEPTSPMVNSSWASPGWLGISSLPAN